MTTSETLFPGMAVGVPSPPFAPSAGVVAVVEHPIATAIKAELLKLLEEPLTASRAIKLARTLSPAIKLLQSTERGVAGLMGAVRRKPPSFMMGGGGAVPDWAEWDDDAVTAPVGLGYPIAGSPGGETFGNQALREFMGGVKAILDAKRKPATIEPEDLVKAIAAARDAGDTELVTELRQSLRERLAADKVEDEEEPKDQPVISTGGSVAPTAEVTVGGLGPAPLVSEINYATSDDDPYGPF